MNVSIFISLCACRYRKGSVLAPVTGGRLVTPVDNGKDVIPRYSFRVSPVLEPAKYTEDVYGCPVQPIDCRPISFEIRRRQIELSNDDGLCDSQNDFDLNDCLESELLKDLDPALKIAIRELTYEQRASLKQEMLSHNQWCTEFVPCSMACLACNTAG